MKLIRRHELDPQTRIEMVRRISIFLPYVYNIACEKICIQGT